MNKTTTDNNILNALRHDMQRGFTMFMQRYREPVYWHIRRLVVNHDDAEDVTQEVFVRVLRSIDKFRGECSLTSWVYRIATNEAIRLINSRRSDTCSIDTTSAQTIGNIEADNYVDFDDAIAVKFQQAIHSLPPKQQATFNLRYYDELEYEEIAEITHSTAASAKANYHTAKQKIEAFMNK